jgi:hypothetical protein
VGAGNGAVAGDADEVFAPGLGWFQAAKSSAFLAPMAHQEPLHEGTFGVVQTTFVLRFRVHHPERLEGNCTGPRHCCEPADVLVLGDERGFGTGILSARIHRIMVARTSR